MSRWKIICLNEVYKFSVGHFLTRCLFYVLVLKTFENKKFQLLTNICEIRHQKRENEKLFTSISSTNFFPIRDIWKKIHFIKSCILLESYRNVYRKSSTKREFHDENVFLKADGALSKFNLLIHLKSKTNLVTLRKCNSHLQYYKIDLSFIIKLPEINLHVSEGHKTEREIQTERSAKRKDRIARPRRIQTCAR